MSCTHILSIGEETCRHSFACSVTHACAVAHICMHTNSTCTRAHIYAYICIYICIFTYIQARIIDAAF